MSIQAVAWAISQQVGGPAGKVLLMCLANYADEKGLCWPSQATISREAELCERTTRDWLKKLEQMGFIERTERRREDGSRTSDFIHLCMDKAPSGDDGAPNCKDAKTLQNKQAAESAGRSQQPANDAGSPGISCRGVGQELPGNEPITEPSGNPSPARGDARGGDGGELFEKLWQGWPVAIRPERKDLARSLFEALSAEEQRQAVELAVGWRKRKPRGLMIPYLRKRGFAELADAPPLDRDGEFIITPDRQEWQAWRNSLPEGSRALMEARGRLVCKTRWPEDAGQHPGEQRGQAV